MRSEFPTLIRKNLVSDFFASNTSTQKFLLKLMVGKFEFHKCILRKLVFEFLKTRRTLVDVVINSENFECGSKIPPDFSDLDDFSNIDKLSDQ